MTVLISFPVIFNNCTMRFYLQYQLQEIFPLVFAVSTKNFSLFHTTISRRKKLYYSNSLFFFNTGQLKKKKHLKFN